MAQAAAFANILNGTPVSKMLRNSDVMLIAAVLIGIMMIVIPLPMVLLDFFMLINIMISIIIIITVIYTKSVLDFSVFPTLLLFTTMFRLAVNISSTRLILTLGPAFDGKVVRAFADFVVGGNYVIGLIVFIIITAVQFIVITKGASRISEVAARFTLDMIPGKQMSIDADLTAGIISEQEAIERRRRIEDEAAFFGNMDGATKFVTGDVKAGLLITIINIIGGFIVGMVIHKQPAGEAIQGYLMLSVGDGLVAQIPSLLISVATGIIVTRSISKNNLGHEFSSQLLSNPKSLYISGIFVLLLALFPGFPKIVFFMTAGILFFLGYSIRRLQQNAEIRIEQETGKEQLKEDDKFTPEKMVEQVKVDPIEIEIGYALIPLVDPKSGGDLLERIKRLRSTLAGELGLIVPNVRIRDNMQLSPDEYVINIHGDNVGGAHIKSGRLLAMNTSKSKVKLEAEETREPVFGLPAYWIGVEQKEDADKKGYTVVDGSTVVATHLTELIKLNARDILGRKEVRELVNSVKKRNETLVAEIEKAGVKTGDIQKILQELLSEGISIRNIDRILEIVCDYPNYHYEQISENIRIAFRRQLSAKFADQTKALNAVVLTPQLENELEKYITEVQGVYVLNLSPENAKQLVQSLDAKLSVLREKQYGELLIVRPALRKALYKMLHSYIPSLAVLSEAEVAENYTINVTATL